MGLIESSEDDPNANTTKNKDLPTESNILVVEDPFTPKWSKKSIPNSRQKHFKKQNQTSPVNMNLNSHQLFELFFHNQVTNYHCQQSKLYASSEGNCVYHVTAEEFCALIAIFLTSGYASLRRRRTYWDYLLIDTNLAAGDKLAKVRPFYNLTNEKFLKAFHFEEQVHS